MEDKSTSQISPSTLFSKGYSQFENQMTHALLQFIDAAGYDFLLELTKEFSKPLPEKILTIRTQVHEGNGESNKSKGSKSIPDGEITCKPINMIIESKITTNKIDEDQRDNHIDLLRKNMDINKEGYNYLVYITPGNAKPDELEEHPEVDWISWTDILDRISTYSSAHPKLEYLSNAICELSDRVEFDFSMIPMEERVMVLAGGSGESKALTKGIYHCQPGRKFIKCKYLAFYCDKKISHIFKYEKEQSPYYNGDDLYSLEEVPNIITQPIINDKKDKNGNLTAYTMGSPRYVTLDAIRNATTTTELDKKTKETIKIKNNLTANQSNKSL